MRVTRVPTANAHAQHAGPCQQAPTRHSPGSGWSISGARNMIVGIVAAINPIHAHSIPLAPSEPIYGGMGSICAPHPHRFSIRNTCLFHLRTRMAKLHKLAKTPPATNNERKRVSPDRSMMMGTTLDRAECERCERHLLAPHTLTCRQITRSSRGAADCREQACTAGAFADDEHGATPPW
jgi:hypothetical protein